MGKKMITSESVTEGHPDKIADQISDAIVDAYISADPDSRIGCDVLVKGIKSDNQLDSFIFLGGEITSNGRIDIRDVVRETIKQIGYDEDSRGFNYKNCYITPIITQQSPDIAKGVNSDKHEQGAGDQGMMYGFACNETPEFMPMPIVLAHKLTRQLSIARKSGEIPFLCPDGKSQITIEYENDKPKRLEAIVIAQQHEKNISEEELKWDILEKVVHPICADLMDSNTKVHINSTGAFVIGGPEGDSGVTGRKIIVDTYGGVGRHGGGAFSGKDPSKVDRSAAYAARYIAKNIVAAGLADKCEIQLSYAIGVAKPTGIYIDCFGTNKIPETDIGELVRDFFPLKPAQIIDDLKLKNPIYLPTASYGHFGREPYSKNKKEFFTWEKTDKVDLLKEALLTDY